MLATHLVTVLRALDFVPFRVQAREGNRVRNNERVALTVTCDAWECNARSPLVRIVHQVAVRAPAGLRIT